MNGMNKGGKVNNGNPPLPSFRQGGFGQVNKVL